MATTNLLSLLTTVGLIITATCASVYTRQLLQPFGIKLLRVGNQCSIIEPLGPVQQHRQLRTVLVQRSPAVREEHHNDDHGYFGHGGDSVDEIISILAWTDLEVMDMVRQECQQQQQQQLNYFEESAAGEDEIIPIVKSGDPSNRIDVVLMGDGYTRAERQRFINDSRRLVKEMWEDSTFASTLPLFNVWAVFRPSAESGIGVNGKAKHTAFGLYRDGSELRGVYCSKPQAARQACRSVGRDACDFPSLIGNDDLYGGLGGEFTITTRSPTSGTIVLRHELGHNLVQVGEEYDGGSVYSGVNSAYSLQSIGWKHWLTTDNRESMVREEQNNLLLQQYPWYDLSKGAWSKRFEADGTFKRWLFKMSSSGAPYPNSLIVEIDGKKLPWQSSGLVDRSFFEYFHSEGGFSKGWHTLTVRLGNTTTSTTTTTTTGNNNNNNNDNNNNNNNNNGNIRAELLQRPTQLCSLTLHEFMDEDKYTFLDNSKISAYPTYSHSGFKTYRPTNEYCLMRNMSSNALCPVCKEGLWLNFLKRVRLIDNVVVRCDAADRAVTVVVSVLGLGRFRSVGSGDETLTIRWVKNGEEIVNARNQLSLRIQSNSGNDSNIVSSGRDKWVVVAQLQSSEIRRDPSGLTTSEWEFQVPNCLAAADSSQMTIQD